MGIGVLPLDVFVIICGYLHPNDVLKLAFVNRNTRDLVNTRTVWIDQLLAVIHENGLYAPAFPLRKLSVYELMQTACGPGRMVNRFWAKHKVSGSAEDPPTLTHEDRQRNVYTHPELNRLPNSTAYELPFISRHDLRSLDVPESIPPSQFGDRLPMYTKICLIPGGRFLACVVEKEAFIWDLGPPAQSKHFTPRIYCRWPVAGDEIFMPGPSADGNELRLVMGSMSSLDGHSDSTGTLTIYRIWERETQHQTPLTPHYGQENDETLSSVVIDSHSCPLHEPAQITFFTIVGDIFIYIHRVGVPPSLSGYVVYVWDFVNNTYASWRVAKDFSEAFVDNGFLCMVNLPQANVAGWKIPPLEPWKKHLAHQADVIVPPSFRVGLGGSPIAGLSIPDGNFTGLIGRVLDWYNVMKPLHQFDGIIFDEEQRTEFWTYGMYDWPTEWNEEAYEDEFGNQSSHQVSSDRQRPPYIRLQHAVTFLGDLARFAAITVDPYRICEGHTVKSLASSDSKAWIMVELPGDPLEEESAGAQESIGGMKRSNKIITLELDIPYPIPPPSTPLTTYNEDGQSDDPGATAAAIPDTTVDQLAVAFGELTLGCENLTLPEPADLLGRTDFSFDPCSGRFCYIAAGRQQIGIAEFLKWG